MSPKLTTISLQPAKPGWYALLAGYDAELQAQIKRFPGVNWDGSTWMIPGDCVPQVAEIATEHGYMVQIGTPNTAEQAASKINTDLHDYQRAGVERALEEGSWMLNYEMGLGKTPTAIEVCRQMRASSILILCPALVRTVWQDELKRWWPSCEEVTLLSTGKQAAEQEYGRVVITSYELTGKLQPTRWDAIILDESHYVKNNRAARSKRVLALCRANPSAMKLALTGTPITSEPRDLWHQLECLWPERFGNYWRFVQRYSVKHDNRYSDWDYSGLNPCTAEELQARLGLVCSRTTKMEVAHLLPPFTVQPVRIKPRRRGNLREMLETLGSGIRKQHELDKLVSKAGGEKVAKAVELAQLAMETTSHVCCLAYFRSTATAIAAAAEGLGFPVVYVDGSRPVGPRIKMLDAAKKLDKCLLVATIKSVNVGIDLTKFTEAIFAELYWQPAAMIQALGRFSRLSGKAPSICRMLVLEGSLDEPISYTLMRRLRDQAALFKAGQAESELADSLDVSKMDDEEFLDDVRAAAESRQEEAYL